MWTRRRLESQVIRQTSHRPDFILDRFVFATWYTQPGVLEAIGESRCASGKLLCCEVNGLVSVTGC